MLIEHHPTHLN
jgi:hypothetical protein